MLTVVGLFGRCSIYLCIVDTLTLVAFTFVVFPFSISFVLMVFVFVASAYCFQVKDISWY